MLLYSIDWMKNGWFIGNFYPSAFISEAFEVGHLKHKAGDKSDGHFHKKMTEINYLIKGKIKFDTMKIVDGKQWIIEAKQGFIWVTEPNQVYGIEFVEDSELIVIKTPSVPGDKYYSGDKYKDLWISPEALQEIKDWMPSSEDAEQYTSTFGGELIENYKRS